MNLKNTIVQEAEVKSRRFSKGIYCYILNNLEHSKILTIARENNLLPVIIKKTANFIRNGWDPTTGYALLVPISKLQELKLVAEAVIKAKPDSTVRRQFNRLFVESVIMARLCMHDNPFGPTAIDGSTLCAVVDGSDTAQEVITRLVPRTLIKENRDKWDAG